MNSINIAYGFIKEFGEYFPPSKTMDNWSSDGWEFGEFSARLEDGGYTRVVCGKDWKVWQTGDFPVTYDNITQEQFEQIVKSHLTA